MQLWMNMSCSLISWKGKMADNLPRRLRLKTDADYEKLGIKPPEHIPHEGSESVRPDNHQHAWRAHGGFIECQEGEGYNHGIPYDHLTLRLIGTSPEGSPLFESLALAKISKVDRKRILAQHSK